MIYEYAIEPELVAQLHQSFNYGTFFTGFAVNENRRVSRYPKKWAKMVWQSFSSESQMEKKRLEELLIRLQANMIKRKDLRWRSEDGSWLDNALLENERHPFHRIIARSNPGNNPAVMIDEELLDESSSGWMVPHGLVVKRNPEEMSAAVRPMLACCRWVRFVDPYFSQCKPSHKKTFAAWLKIIGKERPVGKIEKIEIHTRGNGATIEHITNFFQPVIPPGISVTIYQWEQKTQGEELHNRYILTDLGGVAFGHGLDTGSSGGSDDINLLDTKQYALRCRQYSPDSTTFNPNGNPITIKAM